MFAGTLVTAELIKWTKIIAIITSVLPFGCGLKVQNVADAAHLRRPSVCDSLWFFLVGERGTNRSAVGDGGGTAAWRGHQEWTGPVWN